MRGYWLRIALGALGVFAVGMIVVTMIRGGRRTVEEIAEGTGPISIPMAFVPFELAGERMGTLRNLRIFRDSAQNPTRVEVSVQLSDPVHLARLGSCILVVTDSSNHPNNLKCLTPADSVGQDLVQFGEIQIRDRNDVFPFFLTRAQVADIQSSEGGSRLAESATEASEEAAQEQRRIADSIRGQMDSASDALRDSLNAIRQRGNEAMDSVRSGGARQRVRVDTAH